MFTTSIKQFVLVCVLGTQGRRRLCVLYIPECSSIHDVGLDLTLNKRMVGTNHINAWNMPGEHLEHPEQAMALWKQSKQPLNHQHSESPK